MRTLSKTTWEMQITASFIEDKTSFKVRDWACYLRTGKGKTAADSKAQSSSLLGPGSHKERQEGKHLSPKCHSLRSGHREGRVVRWVVGAQEWAALGHCAWWGCSCISPGTVNTVMQCGQVEGRSASSSPLPVSTLLWCTCNQKALSSRRKGEVVR